MVGSISAFSYKQVYVLLLKMLIQKKTYQYIVVGIEFTTYWYCTSHTPVKKYRQNKFNLLIYIIFYLNFSTGFVDICKTNYLTLPFPGDQGFLGVTSSSRPSENSPCILRLSGCSQCRISMHAVGDEWTFPICSNQRNQYSMKECQPG